MNVVKIRRSGTFYQVFDDDCYILYYLFGYQINNNKVGFSKSALNKVVNKLEELKINYEVVNEDSKNNYKTLNKYSKYRELGFDKYNQDIYFTNVIEKIKNIKEDKLDRILKTIEDILDED